MDFITYTQERLENELSRAIEEYEGEVAACSLSEMEITIKQMAHELGNEMMRQWLEAQDEKYPVDERPCECGNKASYVRKRKGMVITLQGRVYYRRTYYVCENCKRGGYPLDEKLAIQAGEMSQEVIKQAAMLGVQDAFGTSSQMLAELTLLELSANSIRKACLEVGEGVAEQECHLQAQSQELESQLAQLRVAEKPARLYGSMDGFMTHFRDGWHEMKAGAWWTTSQRKDGTLKAENVQYYVDFLPAEDFSQLVWATGFERLAQQAQELIFVADGARWIWDIVSQHFPQAVQIVDWYHACQYLSPVAQAAFGDSQQTTAWVETVKAHLWQGNLDAVIAACNQLALSHPQSAAIPARQAVTYYTNNRHRMDYPSYRASGYMIGSGTIESACKQIGLARLKIAGLLVALV